MALLSRKMGGSVSDAARKRVSQLNHYPTLDTWRNPLTRSIARRFANDAWLRTLKEIDFEYRMSDVVIGEVPCLQYETQTTKPDGNIIMYIHGGALLAGSPRINASMILPTCQLSGIEAIGIEYTLLPDAFYPTQINEVDAVYKSLLCDKGRKKIFLFGDSIGSTLALASLHRWKREGVDLPAGAILASPVVDGTGSSDTHHTMDGIDPLIKSNGGRMFRNLFDFYAPGEDHRLPEISPLFGDFSGLPPMLMHVGTREVCLGDAARLSEVARQAGVEVTLRVMDGMYHLFHMNWGVDEAKAAHADIAAFITNLLD